MLQEGDDACVIEVAVADVVADLDAEVAVHLASLDLPACGVGVLEGYLSKGKEPLGCGGTDLEREIVEDAAHLFSLDRIPAVAEEHRRRGDDLHIDAVGIHVCQPPLGIPAVGFDATKLVRAEHDRRVALGVDAEPRPLAFCRRLIGRGEVWPAVRNVVGMNVDGEAHGPAGWCRGAGHGLGHPRPGCTAAHRPQVRRPVSSEVNRSKAGGRSATISRTWSSTT